MLQNFLPVLRTSEKPIELLEVVRRAVVRWCGAVVRLEKVLGKVVEVEVEVLGPSKDAGEMWANGSSRKVELLSIFWKLMFCKVSKADASSACREKNTGPSLSQEAQPVALANFSIA